MTRARDEDSLLDGVLETSDVGSVFRDSFPRNRRAEDVRMGSRSAQARSAHELKTYHSTMLHALGAASARSGKIGITLLPDDEDGPQAFLSYADLYKRARRLAGVLVDEGLRPGSRVLLVMPTSAELIISFFGVQMAGAIPVPAYPPALLEKAETALERLRIVGEHSGARTCISTRTLLPLVTSLGLVCKRLRNIWAAESLLGRTSRHAVKVKAHGRDTAFIQYTSGSTGHPKGAVLSHRNVVANVHAAGLASEYTPDDCMVTWLPLYHDMGLIGALLAFIYWQLPIVMMSPLAFMARPIRWLKAIQDFKGTFSCAPNFAYGLCAKRIRPSERKGLDLSSWRIALNGAEPVNVHTMRAFVEAFEPCGFKPKAIFPSYGLAESTVAVTFPPPGAGLRHETVDRHALANGKVVRRMGEGTVSLVCVGQAVPGHEVRVVDADLRPVSEDSVGHIVVRGPSVMQGYFRDPKATHAVLRDGWLWTGDLGYLTEQGLFVTGRAKDLVIIRGKNYYAEDFERVAEHVEGVRPSGVVAFGLYDEAAAGDALVLVCETKLTSEQSREGLAKQLSESILSHSGVKVGQIVLVPPGTIPRTSSGKRQRNLCKELYVSGDLKPRQTGKLKLAWTVMRSSVGFVSLVARRLAGDEPSIPPAPAKSARSGSSAPGGRSSPPRRNRSRSSRG